MTDTVHVPDSSPFESTAGDRSPAWWTRAVVYQIYPRSFADGNGDGFGDLAGIRSKLDYLAELGVDVIWLSPIYPSPQHDNGYDISDYRGIDPAFGTLEEFDALLAEAHERGLKIVMDLVVNHTSDEHPWFVESRSSVDNPKRNWYWWRRPRMGFAGGQPGGEPTNWTSAFSGPSWTWDETSGEYYLHLFASQQPDLNWENPEVRNAVYEMMNWWLDRGVDGFRMDVINFISKHLDLPDGVSEPGAITGDGAAFYTNGPRIHEFLHEMHEAVFAGRDNELITVGEMPGVSVEDGVLFTDPAREELDMIFQFEHVGIDHGSGGKWDIIPLELVRLKHSLARWQTGLGERGWNSLYLNNHDQPRLVSRYGNDTGFRYESATLWATILHLHRGTPYVYQGEEIGMTNTVFETGADFRDIESVNWYRTATAALGLAPDDVLPNLRKGSRDNARTPVQWTGGENAGFSTAEPWMRVNPNYVEVNAEADRAGERSIFRYYQRLIELRHQDGTVALGDFELLEPDHPTLYAFVRSLGDDALLTVGNVSDEPLDVPLLGAWATASLVIGNYPDQPGTALRPWEVRVYRSSLSALGG